MTLYWLAWWPDLSSMATHLSFWRLELNFLLQRFVWNLYVPTCTRPSTIHVWKHTKFKNDRKRTTLDEAKHGYLSRISDRSGFSDVIQFLRLFDVWSKRFLTVAILRTRLSLRHSAANSLTTSSYSSSSMSSSSTLILILFEGGSDIDSDFFLLAVLSWFSSFRSRRQFLKELRSDIFQSPYIQMKIISNVTLHAQQSTNILTKPLSSSSSLSFGYFSTSFWTLW